MDSPKSRAEMIGEALREIGVLAAVFIPLDHLFASDPELPFWGVVTSMLIYGVGLFWLGMLIEEARQ